VTRTLLRLVAASVAAGLALLLGAAPASAHTRLQGSDPVDGTRVDSGPQTVSLTFNEDVQAAFATLTVVGPDGAEYQTGAVSGSSGRVSTAVSPLGPAGAYRIGYRVVSDDGHPVQGTVSFTLTRPGPARATTPMAAPAPASTAPAVVPEAVTQESGGAPVWPWLVGAVVLVAAGAVAATRLGGRGR
jgi:copper resistance protein C